MNWIRVTVIVIFYFYVLCMWVSHRKQNIKTENAQYLFCRVYLICNRMCTSPVCRSVNFLLNIKSLNYLLTVYRRKIGTTSFEGNIFHLPYFPFITRSFYVFGKEILYLTQNKLFYTNVFASDYFKVYLALCNSKNRQV